MSRPRILVVEDEPAIADTIVYALATDGFDPHWCATGDAALHAARAQPCALAVLDVGLPDINGFELCTRLRKLPNYKKVPVVFITGAVTVQNRVQSSLSGGNDFIAKPFNLLELGVKALIWIFKGQIGMM